jgi:hypothetical protein
LIVAETGGSDLIDRKDSLKNFHMRSLCNSSLFLRKATSSGTQAVLILMANAHLHEGIHDIVELSRFKRVKRGLYAA